MGLLLIDAGNTRIKWALATIPTLGHATAPPIWRDIGSVAHNEIAELLGLWRGLQITRVLISNVAGSKVGARLHEILQLAFDSSILPEWFASVPQLAGVRNAYRNPMQLGCDRFASAIGAHRLYPQQALLLATCGTATTIDVINADGTFIGGMILPGLGLMANALAHGTAQLPRILDHVVITTPFADNTEDAIMSGCIAAQVGAISTALTLQTQHHPGMEIKCILTGGSAGVIAPYLTSPHERVDHLVLTGLWTSIAAETER
ncbi:type III pantothenate kinase [Glaciimonas sp. CA11.2]|uniref:type III pantothenate kinase n=1 Tax=unclassified Glaciimonas TaxID=2644401 RepID=UPI002AB567F3|nr:MULTISPECIES: type III pantothenate kinase [unclassified Glaciimonas]MDY7546216.1 type III pantothenate kinase [Glaciimonas sp. CA11.2]MEB0010835.1 type III pantothenate kinase [Glaciimonas sp. Cout2]MEB0081616.1 type III pantothenate kinase [Glaciimonas sp. Gout2]MEB0162517.1 type III pantothenate kinase [Glaciimonas sp. CA11.2]